MYYHMNTFILRLDVVRICGRILYIIIYKLCRTLGTLPKPFRDIILIGWTFFGVKTSGEMFLLTNIDDKTYTKDVIDYDIS